ncbi:phosphopantetheine-binding protein, partial [Streptomyces albidoflavus]
AFQRTRYWLDPTPHTPALPAHSDDAAFWDAVERADLATVAAALQVDDEKRDALAALLPALSTWRRTGRRAADTEATVPGTVEEPGQDRSAELGLRLKGRPAATREAVLLELVEEYAADVFGALPATGLDPERGFLEQGFDSLTAVELRNLLAKATGLELSSTLLFDHPTPAVLAAYLRTELDGGGGQAAGAGRPDESAETAEADADAALIDDMDLGDLLRLARESSES